ncbi:dihydroneopterin aldolase [bacterium]|nr:dihydroneopterin aldolase [bacterium]
MMGNGQDTLAELDAIRVLGMLFQARHGCTSAEREVGATFSVDVELYADLSRPAKTDDLKDTIDIAKVYNTVGEVMNGEVHNLTEAVAENIAKTLKERFNILRAVTVRIHKSRAPMGGPTGGFEVEIFR